MPTRPTKKARTEAPQAAPTTFTCVVCMCEHSNRATGDEAPHKLGCDHSFCKGCIKSWLLRNTSCPTCRSVVPAAAMRALGLTAAVRAQAAAQPPVPAAPTRVAELLALLDDNDHDEEDSDWDDEEDEEVIQCEGITQRGERCRVTSDSDGPRWGAISEPLRQGSRFCTFHEDQAGLFDSDEEDEEEEEEWERLVGVRHARP